ncbi:MAG: hypothetical protein IJ358_04315 [Clostridia bacterium]|nr:hypothetical protein [Clostridia bacterium]
MKKLKNISLMILSAFIFICSAIVFTGCKDDKDDCQLFVFATEGGYVQVNNSEDYVEFGDEGEIFTFKEDTKVTLKAIANDGYDFVKWEYADDLDERQEDFSTQSQITLVMDDDEIVVRAVFAINGTATYSITYPTNSTGYTIVPETNYSTTVLIGSNFKFKVNLDSDYSNSDITVKINGNIIVADYYGVYTIESVNQNISITVEGVVMNAPVASSYTIVTYDTRITVVPLNTTGLVVDAGASFVFKLKLADGYQFSDNAVVKANGVIINPINNQYTINSVNENIEIKVEGITQTEKCTVTLAESEYFGIMQVDGSDFDTTNIEVERGETFQFRIGTAGDVVVKANTTTLTANNGIYSVEVLENIVISVDVYYDVVISTSDAYQILKEDGSSFDTTTNKILLNDEFRFKVNLKNPESVESITVKANSTTLTDVNGIYSVNVVGTVAISVQIVEKVQNTTYQFNLDFDEEDKFLLGDTSSDIPSKISITISEEDKKASSYKASEFILSTSFGEEISMRDLVATIDEYLIGLDVGFSGMSYFAINGSQFINLDMDTDTITIDWDLIGSETTYDLIIVT